jgi:glycerol-3-phosphate acyltransferase PlsY
LVVNIIAAIVIGYLLGSVPCAYIVARRRKGVDIRKVGGGNVGALNTYREVGPLFGFIVLFADVAKGALAVLVAGWLDLTPAWICVAGFAAVVGHNWPVFLQFRGGKGAATVMGVLLPLAPVEFAISVGIVLLLIAVTSNVRLSLAGLVFIPLGGWLFFGLEPAYIYYALGILLFLVVRTLISLKRELAGATTDKKNLIIDKDRKIWQTGKAELDE